MASEESPGCLEGPRVGSSSKGGGEDRVPSCRLLSGCPPSVSWLLFFNDAQISGWLLLLACLLVCDMASLCSPGWPQVHGPPASVSPVSGITGVPSHFNG